MRVYGHVSEDGHLVLPPAVRAALALSPGDLVTFELDGAHAVVGKVAMLDHLDALAAALPEWATEADAEAYDAL